MLPQQYCLRWRYHHSNLQTMFSQLLEREAFCDVTLACEGKTLKAHKIVLSACSTYFDTILSQYEEKDPILIMKDVKYVDIKCLVEFMYKGEINVDHCHLATLLKTAEELRIKGLAEVSWRDEESNNDTNMNGVQSALPHVSTVMDSPKSEPTNKRKRGRPPIDDYEQTFTTPKITSVTGNAEEGYSNDALSSSDQDLSIWEEESALNDNDQNEIDEQLPQPPQQQSGSTPPSQQQQSSPVKVKSESLQDDDSLMDDGTMDFGSDSKYDLPSGSQAKGNSASKQSTNSSNAPTTSSLTAAIEKEWPDVIKMNDYLSTGRRQQFWEEPFTKRVMDAIKTKNLEMKIAAELLGVSYGTLYGRYRDAYGCLKHPYRVRDFWSEQGPTDILLKLKRKEVTLFRAAEQLNVTPQTLSNYLISMSQLDNEAMTPHTSGVDKYDDGESDEDGDSISPDFSMKVYKNSKTPNNTSVLSTNNATTSVLPNCPDVTVIKKEKLEGLLGKMNNNSDHSSSQSNNSDQSQK